MFPIIRVSDEVLKWLQDIGAVGKTPHKMPLVNKEDIEQCVAKPPTFNIKYEKRYIADPNKEENT